MKFPQLLSTEEDALEKFVTERDDHTPVYNGETDFQKNTDLLSATRFDQAEHLSED